MLADQEGETFDVSLGQGEPPADIACQFGAVFRMVLPVSLADVMQQASEKKEIRGRDRNEKREFRTAQQVEFFNGLQQMAVHRENVIDVVLGQGFQVAELGDVGGQQSAFEHVGQRRQRIYALQDFQEGLAHPFGMSHFFINKGEMGAD